MTGIKIETILLVIESCQDTKLVFFEILSIYKRVYSFLTILIPG